MTETPSDKPYDLEKRTYEFAKQMRAFVKMEFDTSSFVIW